MSRDSAHLFDALNAAKKVVEFCEGMEKAGFLKDEKTQSATLHQLLVIGEAVKRLSQEFRDANRDVPWKEVAGMRDKLIHGYDQVNLTRVWKTVTGDIPQLMVALERLLSASKKD